MEELLERFTSGTEEGWNEFLERYSRLIYKVFCTRSFYFTQDQIEELFQDFLLGMMKNNYKKVRLYEGRNSCSFASYIKKIAINMAIDRRKKLTRERMVSLQVSLDKGRDPDSAELMDTLDSGQEIPDNLLITDEEAHLYRTVLYKLAPAKLLVVLLIVYHRYDREKLALLMSTTRQNIDVIFNRCKVRLMKILKSLKADKEMARTFSPWNDQVSRMREQLALEERNLQLDKAIEVLSRPGELVTGIAFINYIAIEPTPERLASLLNISLEDTQALAEKVLEKLIPGEEVK